MAVFKHQLAISFFFCTASRVEVHCINVQPTQTFLARLQELRMMRIRSQQNIFFTTHAEQMEQKHLA